MPARKKVDRDEFARLHKAGLTQKELAEHFGIARSNVIAINSELGLSRRKLPRKISSKIDRSAVEYLHKAGLTAAQMAEQLHCSEYAIWRIRNELELGPGQRMTPERKARIQLMLDDGWSWAEIERTEGATWDTMTRHFPGTQWTITQRNEHRAHVRHVLVGPIPTKKAV